MDGGATGADQMQISVCVSTGSLHVVGGFEGPGCFNVLDKVPFKYILKCIE